jgi:hypothetical protein
MCSEVWHESAEIYTDISGDFPTTVTGKAKGTSLQVVIHTKFAFSRLEQYGYCL